MKPFMESEQPETVGGRIPRWITIASFVLVLLTFAVMLVHMVRVVFFSKKEEENSESKKKPPSDEVVFKNLSIFTPGVSARSVRDLSAHNNNPKLVFFVSSKCTKCDMLLMEWTALHRSLPILLKPGKNIDLLRVNLTEDAQDETPLGDTIGIGSVVPTVGLLKNGTWESFVQCDTFTMEGWVGFMKKQLPDYFPGAPSVPNGTKVIQPSSEGDVMMGDVCTERSGFEGDNDCGEDDADSVHSAFM
jgi:hypothetical protein